MKFVFLLFLLFTFKADAWMEEWAPKCKGASADVKMLSKKCVHHFITTIKNDDIDWISDSSEGGSLDLNGDRIDDFVFLVPWLGCGLAGSGYDVYFIVSNGAGGRIENKVESYRAGWSDLVTIGGKVYFRQSACFWTFEKSQHSHWVHQVFAFETNGVMRCANADVGAPFPAVTIYYENPKFKQIELTAADLKVIEEKTKPVMRKYVP